MDGATGGVEVHLDTTRNLQGLVSGHRKTDPARHATGGCPLTHTSGRYAGEALLPDLLRFAPGPPDYNSPDRPYSYPKLHRPK